MIPGSANRMSTRGRRGPPFRKEISRRRANTIKKAREQEEDQLDASSGDDGSYNEEKLRLSDKSDGSDEWHAEFDMSEIRKAKLPKQLIIMSNPDKEFHEKWKPGRNIVNVPHPFRAVLFGPPNVGKSTVVKNILMRADPPFEEVFMIHCDKDYTQEYDDIDCEFLDEIPAPDEWQGEVKTLVILEDLEYKQMNKDQKRNLDRLMGYVSTHKNISCCLCAQDAFNIPPAVRRCSNFWVIWKSPDMDSMHAICRRTGLNKKQFMNIFNKLMPNFHDSLWVDMTSGSNAKLRKNGFQIIKMKKDKKV